MRIAGIDPGPVKSALVVCDIDEVGILPRIVDARFVENVALLESELPDLALVSRRILIERIAPFDKRIGWETIETIEWLSKFECVAGEKAQMVLRMEVKNAVCGTTSKVNDAAICDEIKHRYGGQGQAVGTKKSQGPLYILKKDLWQAFALIIAWPDLKQERND
jgi:hypothetical protein